MSAEAFEFFDSLDETLEEFEQHNKEAREKLAELLERERALSHPDDIVMGWERWCQDE